MKRARLTFAGLLIAAAGVAGMDSAASAADAVAAAPLKVKVAPMAGKKVKVARKLKVVASCTSDCAAKVRIKLYTPVGNSTVRGARNLKADQGWITGLVLTRFGLKAVKSHFRQSRLKVSLRARDVSTGRVVKKTRTFRFRR